MRWDISIPIERARMFVGGVPLSGEIQLDILKSEGLQLHHKLLEIGSGAGHLANQVTKYLYAGKYYGIEPNQWTMEENKNYDPELGPLLEDRKAHFDSNDQFDFSVFGDEGYDFIFSHSILSHASVEQLKKYFAGASNYLRDGGKALASLHYAEVCNESDEWQYPGISWFRVNTLLDAAKENGLKLTFRPDIKEYYMSRREEDSHDWILLEKAR